MVGRPLCIPGWTVDATRLASRVFKLPTLNRPTQSPQTTPTQQHQVPSTLGNSSSSQSVAPKDHLLFSWNAELVFLDKIGLLEIERPLPR